MVMVMVMVSATRKSTNIMKSITASPHILQAFEALGLGIMRVDLEVEVLVVSHLIKHLVVGTAGAARLSIPTQVFCSGCSGALADGDWVG